MLECKKRMMLAKIAYPRFSKREMMGPTRPRWSEVCQFMDLAELSLCHC